MMIGKAKVKMTASLSRKNILVSRAARASPRWTVEGWRVSTGGAAGRARVWFIRGSTFAGRSARLGRRAGPTAGKPFGKGTGVRPGCR
ncbi:hypothetical protein GCM10017559_06480 [Streptosporangium longisporum]|uniref:Uncharacterized protein n=1 Tax=Streptosporangium longisporum TaxID=46187 RepID=A0ABP6K7L2_9ACTN